MTSEAASLRWLAVAGEPLGMGGIDMDLPAGEGLRRLARRELAILAKDLDTAEKGAGVHPARKRLKLLRSLLRMLRPAIGEAAFGAANSRLRTAATSLAAMRKGEAIAEMIGKLSAEGRDRAAMIAELHGAARQHVAATAEDVGNGIAIARSEIEAVHRALAQWPLPKRDPQLFLVGVEDCYSRARKLTARGLQKGDPGVLHEARKFVIHHLHHLEILAPVWPRLMEAWCAELDRLRELLGDLNDLDELKALLGNRASPFSNIADKKAVADAIAKHRRQLLKKIEKLSAYLFAERPQPLMRRLGRLWARGRG